MAEPLLLLRSNMVPWVQGLAASDLDTGSSKPSLQHLAAALAAQQSTTDSQQGISQGLCAIDMLTGRLRVDTLLWLEYADTAMFAKYKTLDRALHDERAAIANTAGKAARCAMPDKSAPTAVGHQGQTGSLGSSTGKLGATATASKVQSSTGGLTGGATGLGMTATAADWADANGFDCTFFKRLDAVNESGIQTPFYHLPPSFYKSTYVHDAELSSGETLKARR